MQADPNAPSTPSPADASVGPLHAPPAWTILVRTAIPLTIGIVLALVLNNLVAPELVRFGYDSLVAFAGINIILAVSLNIVNGYAGQFSIGHAGFMALGGYLGAAIVYYATYRIWGDLGFHGGFLSYDGPLRGTPASPIASGELLFLLGCIAGGLAAAAAGWLVGLPSLRLKGDYLAIVTLGFGEIVRVLLQGSDPQIGPYFPIKPPELAAKLSDAPFYELLTHLGGAKSFSSLPQYATPFWIFVWAGITLAVATRLKYSAYGRALLSIREDEVAARSIGVNVTRYNVRAFMISAFFAGVAGVLWALNLGQIRAGDLGFQKSFDIIIMVVLGGLGSISGAVLAAILLTILPEILRSPPSLLPWGLILVAIVCLFVLMRTRRKLKMLLIVLLSAAIYEAIRGTAKHFEIDLAKYRMVFYALALIGLMILRPQGLFGVHEIWEVWPLNLLSWRRWPLVKLQWLRRLIATATGQLRITPVSKTNMVALPVKEPT